VDHNAQLVTPSTQRLVVYYNVLFAIQAVKPVIIKILRLVLHAIMENSSIKELVLVLAQVISLETKQMEFV
jgi:hypothetical protein